MRAVVRVLAVSAALVVAAACTSSGNGRFVTNLSDPSILRPYNFWTYNTGYKDEELGPNKYRVSITATNSTTFSRATAITLTRAAELAKADGSEFFVVDAFDFKAKCLSQSAGGIKGAPFSAQPVVVIDVTTSMEDTFAADAMVFSVSKIEIVLRPEVLSVEDNPNAERAVVRANLGSCSGIPVVGPAAREKMPWDQFDILARPVPSGGASQANSAI
ncbi:MAG: hypothetical protein Pyrs2KO_08980 [Pyruvatibacter sp.]